MTQKQKKPFQSNPYANQGKLAALQRMLCVRMEDLFDALGVGLTRTHKMFFGCCPIHGGDNQNALNIYHSGETVPGFWKCYSKHCEGHFKKTVIGFVRGVLSRNLYGWEKEGDKETTFKEAVDWCCKFIGQSIRDITVDEEEVEKREFVARVKAMNRKPKGGGQGLTRETIRSKIQIPSDYFVKRGWSSEILDKYDVGLCAEKNKPMYNRVVVPIYNKEDLAVGYTCRSIYERCEKCKLFHSQKQSCPSAEEAPLFSKWRNSQGFNRESHLYNFYKAQKHIIRTGVAGICEGPPDVWRLAEASIPVGLGMLGTELTDQQQVLLETSGAMTLVILTNQDGPGKEASKKLEKQLSRCYHLVFPEFPTNDIGEMCAEETKDILLPVFQRAKRIW